jgi:murein DD-endopeptidase MepM/ murein hydrolase activator NlpD
MRRFAGLAIVAAVLVLGGCYDAGAQDDAFEEAMVKKVRRIPVYPADRICSRLTSLFSSWTDVDGSKRSEPHSGVDGGRLGDAILAPAPGVVLAVWRANWGWGPEGALLIGHSRDDIGLRDGPSQYFSEFDHLRYDEIRSIPVGQRVQRGERLATVFLPGGNRKYLPEVHWEVWAIDDDKAMRWRVNRFGGRYWRNSTGQLVDPLFMLSLNAPAGKDGKVEIPPFDPKRDYRGFRGFTYILPCAERKEGTDRTRRRSSRR